MRPALLLLALAILALAAPASAGDDLVSVLLEHASDLTTCIGAEVQGSIGISYDPDDDPPLQVTTPALVPPSPSCLPTLP
ncbi:MAG TPA: hypothetical protein VGR28_10395 [Candidatus Thermoplasmatota archaeon]|jgi:hypothetical protein|nr:hypothetical protein [Candidatus Thermoplasmatota archaeon]